MSEEITTAITESVTNPKSVQTAAGSTVFQSIPDQIAADNHLASKSAVANTRRRGLVITKLRPPGST